MNERLRQSIIAFIWPGPIAGPLPINLFRIVAPLSVFYLGPFLAVPFMWFWTAITAIYFYRLLELTKGKSFFEGLLRRTPEWVHHNIERRGPIALFFVCIILGVFTYAILLRLLRYPEKKAEMLLIGISLVSSVIWTGFFWGTIVEIGRMLLRIAF